MSQSGNPVNWFEIPVTDLDRAKAFYEQVVGTNLDVFDRGAVRMAWFPRPENAVGKLGRSSSGARTDVTMTAVEKHGGKVVMPKTQGGEHGAIAHFEDSEGNLVALFENT